MPQGQPPPPQPVCADGTCTESCAELRCTSYTSPAQALQHPALKAARVIGFGEAHAPSGYEGRSTARRFTEDLLPHLAPQTGRLLVELLAPPSGCEAPRKDVQAESDAITEGQAEHNQSEYLRMGHAARRLGIVPDVLRPTCEDMKAIAASEVRVLAIMETIATLSARVTERWLAEPAVKQTPDRPLVLLYGGALHNDLRPRDNLENWSYGPRLVTLTADRYVEVDLVVPELALDTESWQKFHWYAALRSLPAEHGFVLVQVSEQSFALVFPRAPK